MLEDTFGYHLFVSVKALNTECWDPVLFVSYRERVRKIPHKNEYRKWNRPISDGFPRTSKTDDSYQTTRTLVISILANFAANLSGREWVYSLNRVTILCINVGKIDFLRKKLTALGKILSLEKICWGEDADNRRHFLNKKKNLFCFWCKI